MRDITRVVALAAVLWGAGYLGWRALVTADEVDLATWIILLLAEVLGFTVFGARVWQAWPASPPVRPEISVVIDATGALVDDVRATLIAVREMHDRPGAIVVDQRADRWLRTVAERFGACVLDREVDLGTAISETTTDWVLYLRPGDEPVHDLVDRVARSCGDPMAVVQLATEDLDPSPLDDDPGSRFSTDAFECQVVRPALAARMSVPWYGDSPALIRGEALARVGLDGQPVDDTADDADRWWRTGVFAAGGRTCHGRP